MAKDVSVNVGELKIRETKDEATGELTYVGNGEFRTLQNVLQIGLRVLERDANAPKATDDTPTHRVIAMVAGGSAEIGVAWEREIEKGDFKGRPMFSIAMNHPDLPEWAGNLAAFPRGNSGGYIIVHQRRRQPAPAQAKGGAPVRPDIDDEIPF